MNYLKIGFGIVVLAAILFLGVTYPKFVIPTGTVGATFGSAKIAAINITPATADATSSSILNGDANGRWILSGFTSCTGMGSSQTYLTGAGLASLKLQAATTSVANLGLQGSTNLAINQTVGTSTEFSNNSTTTINANVLAFWAPNTYLTFTFNATNTAACTTGVYYIAS